MCDREIEGVCFKLIIKFLLKIIKLIMLKVLSIFGTRPEAIKMAPVIKELRKHPKIFNVKICVTGQHRLLLDQVLNLFEIKVDYDLNLMKENQNLFELSSGLILGLKKVLQVENPDICLVQGDTSSAFIGGLASFYNRVKVGHIEAGLRTKDKYQPFPEEINRHLIGVLADLHFAPTKRAKSNLLSENVPENRIFITGNTVIDALLTVIESDYEFKHPALRKINFNNKIILVTVHRRENFGEPLRAICLTLKELAEDCTELEIVLPVHLNPNVRRIVYKVLKNARRINLIPPLDYKNFSQLLKKTYLVLTDSGGIQEEAPSLGIPVLVMRDRTERPEAIEAGTAIVVGTKKEDIRERTLELISNESKYRRMANAVNPYGDGKAAQRIVEILAKEL